MPARPDFQDPEARAPSSSQNQPPPRLVAATRTLIVPRAASEATLPSATRMPPGSQPRSGPDRRRQENWHTPGLTLGCNDDASLPRVVPITSARPSRTASEEPHTASPPHESTTPPAARPLPRRSGRGPSHPASAARHPPRHADPGRRPARLVRWSRGLTIRTRSTGATRPSSTRPSAPRISARMQTTTGRAGSSRPGSRDRRAVLGERTRLRTSGNLDDVARLNSVLASEAFERAASVTTRWLDRRDRSSGLFPHTLRPEGRFWSYGDAGSDLFPFLGIATRLLLTDRYGEILATLAAERRLTHRLPPGRVARHPAARRARAGEGDARRRRVRQGRPAAAGRERSARTPGCRACARSWTPSSTRRSVQTPAGDIPSHAAEVNGSALQALARLTWVTNDPRYLQMGRRSRSAYLDHALPTTEYLPPHRWDFMENEPIGPRRFYLGDHGNEIVSGLVEWHRVEVQLGLPEADRPRRGDQQMLDRLLEKGRAPKGLWYELHRRAERQGARQGPDRQLGLPRSGVPGRRPPPSASGPIGDHDAPPATKQAAAMMLRAVTAVDFYEWESGDMDGYADTLESALYLLRYLDDREAADWVDEQIGGALRLPARRRLGDGREHRRELRADRHAVRAVADARHPPGAVDRRRSRWAPRWTVPACASTSTPRRRGPARLLFDTPRHREFPPGGRLPPAEPVAGVVDRRARAARTP